MSIARSRKAARPKVLKEFKAATQQSALCGEGAADFYIQYDGTDPNDPSYVPTYRVNSVRLENSTDCTARLTIYEAGASTGTWSFDVPPNTTQSQTIPQGRNYSLENYDVGVRLLT